MEVVIMTDDKLLGRFRVSELTPLIESINHPSITESIRTAVRLVSMAGFDISQVPSSDCKRMGIIVISSQFVDGPQNEARASERAMELVIASVRSAAPVGLIAITDFSSTAISGRPPPGIDWVVTTPDENLSAKLREAIKHVAFRLWYKAPPPHREEGGATAKSIVLDYARSAAELEQTFKLRYQVYDLLGYLEEPIRSSGSHIDVDAFDRDAIHLVARDVRNNKVVGCLLLILPSRMVNPVFEEGIYCPAKVTAWCDELGASVRSKAVRNRLQNGTMLELPCASMAAFERLMSNMRTQDCCEVSRLIVAPDYRGLDLSSRLMEIAIQLGICLNRKIMLIECVPSHRRFYESFGFQIAGEDSDKPAAVHQLHAHAITMWLNLADTNFQPKTKSNLLIALSSREIRPEGIRKLTAQLKRELPLELWWHNCWAAYRTTPPLRETKQREPSEDSLSVCLAASSQVSELAQAIARLLAEWRGLSIRIQERNADREFRASGGQSFDWKKISNDLLKLLQWTDSATLSAQF
jgi:GNAT superfamily N-acetyltransferase